MGHAILEVTVSTQDYPNPKEKGDNFRPLRFHRPERQMRPAPVHP